MSQHSPVLSARSFLVSGLLVGLLAGFCAFVVGYVVAEPHVQAAIDIEEAHAPVGSSHDHGGEAGTGHSHDEDATVVSRHNQRTWGLLTGTLVVGLVFGGIVALVAAGVAGRLGALSPGQSTALVALIGWVSVAFVPWLKYPASPPAVGNPDTIGSRSGSYFLFLLISVLMAVVAGAVARRIHDRAGAFPAVVIATAAYLVVMIAVGRLLPTVNELGDFPADTLWYFRRSALIVSATMWAVIGVGLTAAVRSMAGRHEAVVRRRELAASL